MWLFIAWLRLLTIGSSVAFQKSVALLINHLPIAKCARLACQNSELHIVKTPNEVTHQLQAPTEIESHEAIINNLVYATSANANPKVESNGVDIRENTADGAALFIMDTKIQERLFGTAAETDIEHDLLTSLAEKMKQSDDYDRRSSDSALVVDDIDEAMLQQIRKEAQEKMKNIMGTNAPNIASLTMQAGKTLEISNGNATQHTAVESEEHPNLPEFSYDSDVGDTDDAVVGFTELVKASMAERMQHVGTGNVLGGQLTSTAMNKANALDKLNVRGILGDSLFTIAETLGVNISEKLAQSEAVQNNLQKLLSTDSAELNANLASLEAQSQQLYEKLTGTTAMMGKTERVAVTASDATAVSIPTLKSNTMGVAEAAALQQEMTLQQDELGRAAQRVADSQRRLQDVLNNMRDNADLVTSLALFQLQPTDKKIAFILGLALFFKVPFDLALHTVISGTSIQQMDHAQWGLIALQGMACVACMQYYGLWKAISVSIASWGSRNE